MEDNQSIIQAVVRQVDCLNAVVEVEHGGCGRCHEKGGCGGQQLTQMFCSGQKTYRVENSMGARVGERVTVAVSAGSVRRTANLAYGLPLLATIAGAVGGTSLNGDAGGMIGALLGLVLSFLYIRFRARRDIESLSGHPHIISRS